jgi:pimeloyl-ACP methyl ester carboxylesterase
MGDGSPAVILEAGMSGWSTDWAVVQPAIAPLTRVCAYDRAGYGWSEEGPLPRTSQQVVTELHTLLQHIGVLANYILVGHSLGGLDVQLYARRYPHEIAGIVLVDSVHPEQTLRMRADVRQRYEGNLAGLTLLASRVAPFGLLRLANQPITIIADKLPEAYQPMDRAMGFQTKAYRALAAEMAAFQASQEEVQHAGPLPHVPVVVLSSTELREFPPGFSGEYMQQLWQELQQDLADQIPSARHIVVAQSGHYIHLDRPEVVIAAIDDLVMQQRKGD